MYGCTHTTRKYVLFASPTGVLKYAVCYLRIKIWTIHQKPFYDCEMWF